MATPKKPKTKARPKLEQTSPVTQFKIPCGYEYAVSPIELASDTAFKPEEVTVDNTLEAATVGKDHIAVRNSGCDETFIIHKDTLKELAEAAG